MSTNPRPGFKEWGPVPSIQETHLLLLLNKLIKKRNYVFLTFLCKSVLELIHNYVSLDTKFFDKFKYPVSQYTECVHDISYHAYPVHIKLWALWKGMADTVSMRTAIWSS